jgi:eukaryotic-like serine/threonine-protein kinase
MANDLSALPSDSTELLRRLAAGDELAAATIFERYVERLTRLARSRLAAKLAARVDPEDIVLSAYRSFFVAVRQGRFCLRSGGDLWRLLVEVTLHKLYHHVEFHLAQRRSTRREQATPLTAAFEAHIANGPTPDEVVAAADELEFLLEQLDERSQQVVELRLQGREYEEIADRLSCSERTVRRSINLARRLMAARGGKDFVPSAARAAVPMAAKSPPDRAGEIVDRLPLSWSDFVLRAQIGIGATGRVYRAWQVSAAREVAVKFLRKPFYKRPAVVRRFLQEVRTVAELSHSGIVPIHGVGRTPGGGLFLVMELLPGPDLDRMSRERAIALEEAIRWVEQAARTLQFAHEHGVIHCDLKPSNLLLDDQGGVRVTDFGLAVRLSESPPASDFLAGTPAFMAPEQIDPCWGAVSPRTDVWGLGSVLYFLLGGRPPHVGPDVPTTLAQVVSKAPVRLPEERLGHLPPVLAILRCCLEKRSGDRFQSAGELALALADLRAPGA